MDIKRVLITDDVSETVVVGLRSAGLTVDLKTDASTQRIVELIQTSTNPNTPDYITPNLAPKDYDAILVRSRTQVTRQIIEQAKKLKLIARAGVGIDNVDLDAANDHKVLVINAPNGNTISACELTCAHILTISRNLYQATKSLKDGVWNRKDFFGFEVCDRTLGIIGLGRIGREVAKRMIAFGMKVIGYDPMIKASQVEHLGIEFVQLPEIWRRSDYVTIHVPLTPETQHMVNRETLAQCKPGVMLINCARGGIVDENALLDALNSRHVHAAALDVFEEEPPMNKELIRHAFLNPTPHLGACTHDGQRRVGEEIVEQFIKLNKAEKVPGAVNANKTDFEFLKS